MLLFIQMMRLIFIFLFLILGATITAAVPVQPSQSIITVNINESGDAVWTMEKFFPLPQSDFSQWESAIKTGQNMSNYRNIPDYEIIIKSLQDSAMITTTEMVSQMPKEMLLEISEIPGVWTKIVQSVQDEFGNESIEELEKAAREQRLKNMGLDPSIPLSELAKEDLEDEEMVKQFLLRSGGQAYQTDIVEHSGLSKSKISMVLSKMKDDGTIIKIRKGKENLIRLVQ